MRPGAKLLGLFGFATAVVWAPSALSTTIALGIATTLSLIAGLRGRHFWRVTRGFPLIGVPLFAFTAVGAAWSASSGFEGLWSAPPELWLHGLSRAYIVVGNLFALMLAASAVTASTALEDMLDTITWALRPLGRIGLPSEQVSLAFALVITAIPNILSLAHETRDAARARGLERSLRALVVPLALRTVAHAQLTGDALAARGLGED
jgi:biotin transport system permease protein